MKIWALDINNIKNFSYHRTFGGAMDAAYGYVNDSTLSPEDLLTAIIVRTIEVEE